MTMKPKPHLPARAWAALIGLVLCLGSQGVELETGRGPVVRAWGTDAGLPQNTVNCMVQTREGYLWVGTREGLARFDGVRFRVFGLEDGLRSVEVQTLYEDGEGTLWIGTTGGGICRFREGRIEEVKLPMPLAGMDVISVLNGDDKGRLWVGTPAGLGLWDRGKFVEPEGLQEVRRTMIRALERRADGGMWIATQRGLYEYDGEKLRPIDGPEELPAVVAHCLLEDRSGALWVSVGNGMVLRLEPSRQWRVYKQEDGVPYAYVTCLAQAKDGVIWAGSLDDGLYAFDGRRFNVMRMADGLSSDAIRSLLSDREGNLWVGTRTKGLNRLTGRKVLNYGKQQGLTNDFTRSVAQTADGALYVGTTGGGLYRGENGWFAPFPDDADMRFFANVESILVARDGSLWWGANGALVHWREGRLATIYRDEPWIRFAGVRTLCEDEKGAIWIGTTRGRVLRHENGSVAEFSERVMGGAITAMAHDPAGGVWVGSSAGGVNRIRWGDAEVFNLKGLPSQAIRTLYVDGQGTLWIGTAGGGLSRWKDGRLSSYGLRQGLGADTVSQIVEDDLGNLWLGTSLGIVRVVKRDLELMAEGKLNFLHPRSFGRNEGMPAEECSSGFSPAGLKLRDGRICFSTVSGLVIVDPNQELSRAPLPVVRLEEVRVNGKPIRLGDGAEVEAVQIPPGARELEVQYTGISLGTPDKVRFRYRLEGITSEWLEAGTRRTAYYPRVPPGDYEFVVMACSADGVWAEPGAHLKLSVQPYLWETRWFMVVGSLVLLGSFGGVLRLVERRRYHRRLELLQMQHAVEKERLRISQDMHDHLGGILTQVSQLSDLGQGDVQGQPQVRGRFERIGGQARLAVQSLDEIIWATDPKNDNLPRFADYVSRFADEFFEGTGIRCWQELPPSLPNAPLRSDLRHNVFLAYRESLHNVLKHAHASEVWIRLRLDGWDVQLEVEDKGEGFEQGKVAEGHGLGNMRKRLEEDGGRMELTSQPGRGTRVTFWFPVGPSEGTSP